MSKLDGLPKIYYINLDTATDRNEYMLEMFSRYGIANFERFNAKKFKRRGHSNMSAREYSCMISHIYVLSKIANSNDEYAIVVEDDVDISTIDAWNFSWNEFFNRLPEFDIVQLSRHQYRESWRRGNKTRTGAKFKVWDRGDVSTVAYLVTREYARQVVSIYKKDMSGLTGFNNYSNETGPVADHALYDGFKTYSTCIFGFKNFKSQISDPNVIFEPFLDNLKYMDSIFEKKISIDDIFDEMI